MTKKIKKIWEDITGVSPIIAVILMVAITVVLAATIYVWVSGFGGGESTNVAMTFDQKSHIQDGSDYNVTEGFCNFTVQSVQGDPGWEDFKILLGGVTIWDGEAGTRNANYSMTVMIGTTTVIDAAGEKGAILAGQTFSLTVDDLNDIDVGDALVFIHIDSGGTILNMAVTY